MPITHALRRSPSDPDPRFTLNFDACRKCGLLQIIEPIAPDILYSDADTYTTGFHRPRHLDDLVSSAIALENPGNAIDVGCNDGHLMDILKIRGYTQVVGIEPNRAAAAIAAAKGHEVRCEFLSVQGAAELVENYGTFDIAYVRHVLEHVGDLATFFSALRRILRDDALLVVELPQVEAGYVRGNPAILWEEHVSYFTEGHAMQLLATHGFEVLDRRYYAFGGGAIGFIARKRALAAAPAFATLGEVSLITIKRFVLELDRYRASLRAVAAQGKALGYPIAIYGAAPRSCVIAAACGITESIDLVIDDRTEIQGRLMPGTSREIESLVSACERIDGKLLCLLGVGSENEFTVQRKLLAQLHFAPVCISLFPPRDTLASVSQAERLMSGSQANLR
jgi:SAM-dependent methyltransferase